MDTLDTVKDFLSFLKKPQFNHRSDEPVNLISIINVFFLVFLTSILLFSPIVHWLGIDESAHMMEDLIKNTSKLNLFIMAVIAAPFLEEFLFRFHLRYKPLMVVFTSIIVLAIIGKLIFSALGIDAFFLGDNMMKPMGPETFKSFSFDNSGLIVISVLVLIGTGWFLLYFTNSNIKSRVEGWVLANFGLIFYLTAFVFAIAHVSNWKENDLNILLTPLLVLPQLLIGLYLGYIRTRNNIWSSMMVHAMNNMIPVLLIFVSDYLDIAM